MLSVFPAPAGINRRIDNDRKVSIGVPRASGDKPQGNRSYLSTSTCSPRQRG